METCPLESSAYGGNHGASADGELPPREYNFGNFAAPTAGQLGWLGTGNGAARERPTNGDHLRAEEISRPKKRLRQLFSSTNLLLAAQDGDEALLGAALRNPRTNPNVVTSSGNSALIFCADKGCVSMMKLLLLHARIDPNIANEDGDTGE